MKKIITLFCLIFFSGLLSAQEDASKLRISILTCSPSEELYSTFGHSAVRVVDSSLFTDYVFNYGTFDFSPDFYLQFVKGKLNYKLAVEHFKDFMMQYQYEDRSVKEQVLALSASEKIALYEALKTNAKPENRYYKYDFLYDNCATRIRDIVKAHVADPQTQYILPHQKLSFRDLIHDYLNLTKLYWSKLGIDILLGAGLDKKVTNEESMFLPDYLYMGFDSTTAKGRGLVLAKSTLFNAENPDKSAGQFFTPFVTFALLLFVFIALAYFKKYTALNIADSILFILTGLLGVLLIVMWTATDHQLCANNMNLFWAIPVNVVAAFSLRKKDWTKTYWKVAGFIYVLLLLSWTFLPQDLNRDLLPLVILLCWRSWAAYNAKK